MQKVKRILSTVPTYKPALQLKHITLKIQKTKDKEKILEEIKEENVLPGEKQR